MRGQKNNPVLSVVLQHVPHGAPGTEIHTSGWLVEQNKSRVAAECDGNGEFPSISSREGSGGFFLVWSDTNIVDQVSDLFLLASRVTTLELVEDVEVLLRSEQVEQNVVLWTHSHVVPHFIHLTEQIVAKNTRLTSGSAQQASQHRNSG